MNPFEKVAKIVVTGQFAGAISGYQTETEQVLMDKINNGFEIEDPNNVYDEQDRFMSASGTIADFFSHDEEAAEEYLKKL